MTALQNVNKENLDSLDISLLIQFEEPKKNLNYLVNCLYFAVCHSNSYLNLTWRLASCSCSQSPEIDCCTHEMKTKAHGPHRSPEEDFFFTCFQFHFTS